MLKLKIGLFALILLVISQVLVAMYELKTDKDVFSGIHLVNEQMD